MEGLGIAIVRLRLMREELADGRLVALFERNIVHDQYSFMFAESRLRSSRFRLFRQWLRDAVVQ